MKRLLSSAFVFPIGLVVLFAGVAGSAGASTIDVKVPFPFVVQGRTLPAGQYRVTSQEGLVELKGEKGNRARAMFFATPASGHDPSGSKPALTFSRYETGYRLRDIWESGDRGLEPLKR